MYRNITGDAIHDQFRSVHSTSLYWHMLFMVSSRFDFFSKKTYHSPIKCSDKEYLEHTFFTGSAHSSSLYQVYVKKIITYYMYLWNIHYNFIYYLKIIFHSTHSNESILNFMLKCLCQCTFWSYFCTGEYSLKS